jgi:hypothetical protein
MKTSLKGNTETLEAWEEGACSHIPKREERRKCNY